MYNDCQVEWAKEKRKKKGKKNLSAEVFTLNSITAVTKKIISSLLRDNLFESTNQINAAIIESTEAVAEPKVLKTLNRCAPADEFLTFEQINKILKCGQDVPQPSRAAISKMVGLSWEDIDTLCWEEFEMSGKTEYRIRLKNDRRTSTSNTLPAESAAKTIQELEEDNRRLRQMYMDLSLEHRMLKDSINKNSFAQYEYLVSSKYN